MARVVMDSITAVLPSRPNTPWPIRPTTFSDKLHPCIMPADTQDCSGTFCDGLRHRGAAPRLSRPCTLWPIRPTAFSD